VTETEKSCYDFAYSSKEYRDNFKELKTFCSFTGGVCFSSWGKWCRPIYGARAGAINFPIVEDHWLMWPHDK